MHICIRFYLLLQCIYFTRISCGCCIFSVRRQHAEADSTGTEGALDTCGIFLLFPVWYGKMFHQLTLGKLSSPDQSTHTMHCFCLYIICFLSVGWDMEGFVALYVFKAWSVGVQVKKLFVILQNVMFSWFPSSGFYAQI